MKNNSLTLVLGAFLLFGCEQAQKEPNTNKHLAKAKELLSKMTLEEKVGQLNLIPFEGNDPEELRERLAKGEIGAILKSNGVAQNKAIQEIAVNESRLGIPVMFQEDVIHGYKTIAPIPLAEAASWNLELIEKSASIAGQEAAASGIHLTYAPMVDIARDPRWGRILEAAGEDVYLGGLVAAARVRGFQGTDLSANTTVMACVKHFAGYGASLAGRDYNIIDFSERELREIYLPPFQAAVDAGVGSVMCAYSTVNSVPACANKELLDDILRKEMGFEGLLMTDWSTIKNLVRIGVAENDTVAAMQTINAGMDLDMTSEQFVKTLPYLVRSGLVDESEVDRAVLNVLIAKSKVGLFEDPFGYFDEKREQATLTDQANWNDTKQIAMESMVLLKNEDVLPVQNKRQTIAVIGPLAKSKIDLLGWWHCKGEKDSVISIYEGIAEAYPNAKINYAKGCDIDSFRVAGRELIPEAVKVARQSDLIVLAIGEEYWMSGEGGGTASLRLPGAQEELIRELSKTGKPIVTILVNGRPYVLTEIEKYSDAILEAWMPGTTGGAAVADVLQGKHNPSGRLPVTFPYHEGQVPIYYDYRMTSHDWDGESRYRTRHLDIPHEPLYEFGYGLSYTSFDYSDLKIDNTVLGSDEQATVSVTIKNSGEVQGTEIVQLYIRDKVCSIARPVKELKGFERIVLQPGEEKTVEFKIGSEVLSFLGADLKSTLEPGDFDIMVGKSSAEYQTVLLTLK